MKSTAPHAATTTATTSTETGLMQRIASKYISFFSKDQRMNGPFYWYPEASRPVELSSLITSAHGGMWPSDDYKHKFILDSLCLIAESNEGEEDVADGIEADPYIEDLLKWLSSNIARAEYVDNWMAEYQPTLSELLGFGLMAIIGFGQVEEKREVFSSVLSSLRGIDAVPAAEEPRCRRTPRTDRI